MQVLWAQMQESWREFSGLCHAGSGERGFLWALKSGASGIDTECCYECFMSEVSVLTHIGFYAEVQSRRC